MKRQFTLDAARVATALTAYYTGFVASTPFMRMLGAVLMCVGVIFISVFPRQK
jgi:hypothetical protein